MKKLVGIDGLGLLEQTWFEQAFGDYAVIMFELGRMLFRGES